MQRRSLLKAAACLSGSVVPLASFAQDGYPNKAVTLVIPFPPGGMSDVIGRLMAERLSQQLGQPVVVDNKPGVNGSLASGVVAKAKPDGYTLVMGGPGTMAVNQLVNPNVKYDARKDFSHIALVSRVPVLMLASPALKASSVADVIAISKAKPGSLNVALTGMGSSGHMTTELFQQAAGISLNPVPYKGDVPAMTDLIGGQADLLFVPATSALTFVQAGKLKALAVAGNERLDTLPNVPTMAEVGQPQIVNYAWSSLEGPPDMPAALVKKLNQMCQTILAQPDVISRFSAISNKPTPGTPAQASSFIAAEIARWTDVVKAGNLMGQ